MALGPRGRVLMCQLPFTLVMTALIAASPTAWPGMLSSDRCLDAIGLHVLLLAACVLVPWQRFGPSAPLLIPVLDLAVIGLAGGSGVTGAPHLGVLSVLPVVWISASRLSAVASLSLSFFGPLLAG